MSFTAMKRDTKEYLYSPHVFADKDEMWMSGLDADQAHEFASRSEAKKTIRRINPNWTVGDFEIKRRFELCDHCHDASWCLSRRDCRDPIGDL